MFILMLEQLFGAHFLLFSAKAVLQKGSRLLVVAALVNYIPLIVFVRVMVLRGYVVREFGRFECS